jgi:acylphosphatase
MTVSSLSTPLSPPLDIFEDALHTPRMSDRRRTHVYVSGKVQGVYFRATTREEAQERGVDGWVRNLPDGRVEAVFEGPREDVAEMVEFCHEGSQAARVEDVDVTDEEPQGEDGFEVRW